MSNAHSEDIADWTDGARETSAALQAVAKDHAIPVKRMVALEGLRPAEVYALLTCFISPKPNGFYTFLGQQQEGMPGDGLIWWDFALTSGDVLLTIRSGVAGLYCDIWNGPEVFDPERLLESNIQRHNSRIKAQLAEYECHHVFVNHYASYERSLFWILEELKTLTLAPPPRPPIILPTKELADAAMLAETEFMKQSLKFHVLAKSFVLNAAFKCEALLNALLRIGSPLPLRTNPKALRLVLRSNFRQKLEILHSYSILIAKPISLNAEPAKAAFDLMEKRNKYVHAEDSEHTRLDDAMFDGPFPLYGNGPHSPLTDFALRAYHVPSMADVEWASRTEKEFAELVLGCVKADNRDEVELMLKQTQLGFDPRRAVFSVPYPSTPFVSILGASGEHDSGGEVATGPGAFAK